MPKLTLSFLFEGRAPMEEMLLEIDSEKGF